MAVEENLIGRSLPRTSTRHLTAGRGRYVDDLVLPRMLHMALVRSPYAHARIAALDVSNAVGVPGVHRVLSGRDLAAVCQPFVAALEHVPDMPVVAQHPLAIDEVAWQGEAVCAVLADSRAVAEDAAERVEVDWQDLPAVASPEAALVDDAPPVHGGLRTNLTLEMRFGDADQAVETALESAAVTVAQRFEFGRQTGVSLETRGVLADFNPDSGQLEVHQSHQVPFQMQEVYARHLGLEEHRVRVRVPDVGGAFGVKLHAYADELAAVAASVLTGRPVKYVVDRQEAFLADVHAREMVVEGRLGVDGEGRIAALDVDVVSGIGAYHIYPRTSVGEGVQATQLCGAPYRVPVSRGRVRVAYQNKAPSGAYRAVGQPVACAVTEQLLDLAAAELGIDPVEIRRRNHRRVVAPAARAPDDDEYAALSLDACLERLIERMDYAALRREQASLRKRGVHRGVGIATFLEQTGVGSSLYGRAGIRVSAQEGVSLRLDPSGRVRLLTSVTDQGQGSVCGLVQVVAATLGVNPDAVLPVAGDSGVTPYGGGAWASRGVALGGEAARLAADELRARLLAAAAAILDRDPDRLVLVEGRIHDADGTALMTLAELAARLHFRQETLPPGVGGDWLVTRHFVPHGKRHFLANGIQASHLEVDVETGHVRLLGHWVVEDCGRIVNPLLVDEQIRGGVVQGIGAALYEHCRYDAWGQMLNASLADYAVPLASEMPDIDVAHVETPEPGTVLGAKGLGEAGTLGAPAAIWTALNDALRPLGARVWRQPFTPAHLLEALSAAGR